MRLAKAKDGSIRFSQSGRPSMKVAQELNSQITIVRENFVAGLQTYTGMVQQERPDAYSEQVMANQLAALPILEKAQLDVAEAIEEARRILRERQGEAAPASDEPEAETEPATEPETGNGSRNPPKADEAEPEPAAATAS